MGGGGGIWQGSRITHNYDKSVSNSISSVVTKVLIL